MGCALLSIGMMIYPLWFYWYFMGLLEEHSVDLDGFPIEILFTSITLITYAVFAFILRLIYRGSSMLRSTTSLLVVLFLISALIEPRPYFWFIGAIFGAGIACLWLPASNDYYFRGRG